MSAPRSRWSGNACRSIVTWKRAHRARAGFARVPARRCTSGQTEFNVMVTWIDRGTPSTLAYHDFPCPCMHVQRAVPWNQREKGEEVIELSALEFPTGGWNFQLNCHWRNSVNFPAEIISFTSGVCHEISRVLDSLDEDPSKDEKGMGIYTRLHVCFDPEKSLRRARVNTSLVFEVINQPEEGISAGNVDQNELLVD